ncbi:LysR family transcriptional regulator [Pseudomonadota bacterium AL_CKDN230030165-1A_HGKHYDSX7]
MLNPVWLHTFATVASAHGFSQAGRELGLTQSTVSEHIRRLEETVGRRLLTRDTHSVALTSDGEAMLAHARHILEAMAHAESQFRSPRLRGRVRLGCSDDIALGPLPSILAAFRNAHPDVELQITIAMTGRLHELLDSGAIDLLVCKRRKGEARGTRLFTSHLQWIARAGTEVDLRQPLPLVLAAEPSITRAVVLDALAVAGASWRIVCTSSSLAGSSAAARGGLGLTVRPQFMSGRGLAPPVNAAALPALPDVDYVAVGAPHLSRPAETLLQILIDSELRGDWTTV